MTATIHQLHPKAGATGKPQTEEPSARMLRALEEFATNMLSEQLRGMFENANKLLFDMADKARNGTEQRLYLDTMRVVKLEQPRLLRAFSESLRQAFATMALEQAAADTDLDDLDNWALQKPDEVEEKIVLGNLETKAEELYKDQLQELEKRFSSMAETAGTQIPTKFFTPTHLFSAFRHTMQTLDSDFQIKLVIYRLFEQTVVGNLGPVFTGANRLMHDGGFEPSQTRPRHKKPRVPAEGAAGADSRQPPGGGPSASGDAGHPASAGLGPGGMGADDFGGMGAAGGMGGAAGPGPMGGVGDPGGSGAAAGGPSPFSSMRTPADIGMSMPAWGGGMDYGRLLEALSRHTIGSPTGTSYTDAELAGEMADSLVSLSQGRNSSSWMPAQNLALVGRMFDGLYRDPRLPGPLKPVLGRLQYPVMKASLADPEFFSNPDHPVRGLVRDVFDMLSSARGARPADVHRLEQLIDALLREFEVDPSRFSRGQEPPKGIDEREADRFLHQQTEHLEEHRKLVLAKVRRMVAQELQLRTVGKRVPDAVMPLLLSGFGPMLAVQFLRGGADCTEWKESIELLEQLLDSLVPPTDDELPSDRTSRETGIIAAITTRLISIGINDQKTEGLVAGLAQAYRDLASVPADAPKPTPRPEDEQAKATTLARQALSVILTPGCWFKVWDSSHQQLRWLKLTAHFEDQYSALFADFSGRNLLKIRTLALVTDLLEGRSEPVDPDVSVQKSMKLLGPLSVEAMGCKEQPVWMEAPQPAAEGEPISH